MKRALIALMTWTPAMLFVVGLLCAPWLSDTGGRHYGPILFGDQIPLTTAVLDLRTLGVWWLALAIWFGVAMWLRKGPGT